MSKVGSKQEYQNRIHSDVLPNSVISEYGYNRIGQYLLRQSDIQKLNEESKTAFGGYEKSFPSRYGIKSKFDPKKYLPSYIKYFDGTVISSLEKTLVNSVLNIYPIPLQAYGVVCEGSTSVHMGVATIDLKNLKTKDGRIVDSIRLDDLLRVVSDSTDISSFYQFQEMIKDGSLEKVMTPRAIVQLGLSKIFIPNAIGETDPNSRNIILLKEQDSQKFDMVVRIDADKNEYLDNLNQEELVITGLFEQYEPMSDHLKYIKEKDVKIDWDLFAGFAHLARDFCSRDGIDRAISTSYKNNPHRFNPSPYVEVSPYIHYYNLPAFAGFSEYTIARAKSYFDNISDNLGRFWVNPPFAESYSQYGNLVVDSGVDEKFIQKVYDQTGREL